MFFQKFIQKPLDFFLTLLYVSQGIRIVDCNIMNINANIKMIKNCEAQNTINK